MIGNSEPDPLSLSTAIPDRYIDEKKKKKWVGKSSKTKSGASLPTTSASHGFGNSEPNPLSLSTSFPDGNIAEKKKKKKKLVGKSSQSSASVASPSVSHEYRNSDLKPLSLSTGFPDGDIAEKKKWVGKSSQSSASVTSPSVSHGHGVSKDATVHISKKISFPDHTQNSLSVRMQNSDNCSKMSKQGPSELSSNSFLEDVVLQCSDMVGLANCNSSLISEDTKNRSHTGCTHNGKENRHFGWNRRQYSAREGRVNWRKKASYTNGVKDVNPPENRFWTERDLLPNDAVLPTPLISPGHNNVTYGYRKGRLPARLLNELSHGAASPKKLNGKLYVSLQSPIRGLEDDSERFIGKPTIPFKPVNFKVRKGPRNYEANFSGLPVKCVSYHKELSQGHFDMHHRDTAGTNGQQIASPGDQHCLNSTSVYSKRFTQGVINGVQPYKFRKIPNMQQEFGKSLYVSVDGIPCCDNDHELKKDTSGANIEKWRAVSTKEFWPMDGISSTSISDALNTNLPDLSRELNNSHLGGNTISCHQPISYEDPKVCQSTAEMGQKIDRKGYDAKCRRPNDAVQFLIGSQMGMKALSAAYQMQLASDMVQLEMGCPLAEFERFIHCAAPVIPSSYGHKECFVSLDTQLSHSFLCKHQIPNVSLHSVWNWYEIPGNYGLDVKAVCSKTLNGSPNDSMPFQAYFVPSVSAIQLFGPHIPGSKTLFPLHSSEAVHVNHIQVGSFDIHLHDGSGPLSQDCSPVFSTDAELIFEFFESELPHHRKPLYNKILELIGAGTSNPHVFGDPSKLATLNLHDLHPASWFSVAWYPIYKIPEGHLRASFLTYHSLGHFVRRPGSTNAPNQSLVHILFPVLGLQSYNSQDEGWFEPKIPSSEDPTSFDTAGVLLKRLRTLDENALHFARGWVYKDKVMVQNRHPDYEFFTSRKTHYK